MSRYYFIYYVVKQRPDDEDLKDIHIPARS